MTAWLDSLPVLWQILIGALIGYALVLGPVYAFLKWSDR